MSKFNEEYIKTALAKRLAVLNRLREEIGYPKVNRQIDVKRHPKCSEINARRCHTPGSPPPITSTDCETCEVNPRLWEDIGLPETISIAVPHPRANFHVSPERLEQIRMVIEASIERCCRPSKRHLRLLRGGEA